MALGLCLGVLALPVICQHPLDERLHRQKFKVGSLANDVGLVPGQRLINYFFHSQQAFKNPFLARREHKLTLHLRIKTGFKHFPRHQRQTIAPPVTQPALTRLHPAFLCVAHFHLCLALRRLSLPQIIIAFAFLARLQPNIVIAEVGSAYESRQDIAFVSFSR